ncbi:MAG: response regulator transcription factor [Lachnospiraceae bacterium]|nr:response regulator transcription factor [Lachnospiraceae bacterium]
MKLLIAEDTADLNRVVTAMLEHSGYSVDSVFDGEAALEAINNNGYDAVLLDIMMPKKDGITVLKEMREKNITVPVLMLTAKAEIDDRVEGLDAGADDYLSKPFAMKELLARVNAMTRRTKYSAASWQYSNFSLDAQTLELSAENSVRLSIKEYELLQLLVTNSEKELDTAFIIEHVWKKEESADADTVFLYVNYLRRKMLSVGAKADISGERGKGFRLMVMS